MSKRTKTTRARREKKAEKAARKPARPRHVPPKTTAPPKPPEKPVEKEHALAEQYLVAIRIDGMPNVKAPEELTLNALRMKSRYSAVLLPDNPSTSGMLQRIKDHATWGEAKREDVELLLSNRAKTPEGLGLTTKYIKSKSGFAGLREVISGIYSGKVTLSGLREMGVEPCFRLHPPRGGFPKSSKRSFADGGELGYRKEGLGKLLAKMC